MPVTSRKRVIDFDSSEDEEDSFYPVSKKATSNSKATLAGASSKKYGLELLPSSPVVTSRRGTRSKEPLEFYELASPAPKKGAQRGAAVAAAAAGAEKENHRVVVATAAQNVKKVKDDKKASSRDVDYEEQNQKEKEKKRRAQEEEKRAAEEKKRLAAEKKAAEKAAEEKRAIEEKKRLVATAKKAAEERKRKREEEEKIEMEEEAAAEEIQRVSDRSKGQSKKAAREEPSKPVPREDRSSASALEENRRLQKEVQAIRAELEDTKAKLEKLRDMRITQQEKMLQDLEADMQKHRETSNKTVAQLEKRKKELESQVTDAKDKVKKMEKSMEEFKTLKRSEQLYQKLTGVVVVPSASYANQFLCSVKTHSTQGAFNLLLDEQPGEVEYTPMRLDFDPKASAHPTLPEFLTETIVFAADKTPVFLAKLLEAVHS